jgi:hypothetical protein
MDPLHVAQAGRTSPRQGIALLAFAPHATPAAALSHWMRHPGWGELRRLLLHDHLASLVAVDGATLSVVFADTAAARQIVPHLPAGVDALLLDAAESPATGVAWTMRHHFDLAFERVVVIHGHALPFPARTAATGLSVLATADLVVGPTPSGSVYLAGARDARGAALFAGSDHTSLPVIEERARVARLVLRRLEPRKTLADVPTPGLLQEALASLGGLAAMTSGWFPNWHELVAPSA